MIPEKWSESLKTIECSITVTKKFSEEWPSNVTHIKLSLAKDSVIPEVLPEGLLKFDIQTQNHNHIPIVWPQSLDKIKVWVDSYSYTGFSHVVLSINKSDLEKYKSMGININPRQLLMITLDVSRSNMTSSEYYSDDVY